MFIMSGPCNFVAVRVKGSDAIIERRSRPPWSPVDWVICQSGKCKNIRRDVAMTLVERTDDGGRRAN
jgi:hypothetical protein